MADRKEFLIDESNHNAEGPMVFEMGKGFDSRPNGMVRPAPQTASQCAKMDKSGEDNHLMKGAERTMNKHSKAGPIKVVGIELAKNIFHLHGVDAQRRCRDTQETEPQQAGGFYGESSPMPCRHGSVWRFPRLGSEVQSDGTQCASDEFLHLDQRIAAYDTQIKVLSEQSQACKRLMTILGVGSMTATALAAVGNAKVFANGREMSAWLGLVPRQCSTGGKTKLLGISKRGDAYLRKLLIHGARSALQFADRKQDTRSRWAVDVRGRRGKNIAAVALANKMVRSAWVLLSRNEEYKMAAAV